jgi:hypothetical protein
MLKNQFLLSLGLTLALTTPLLQAGFDEAAAAFAAVRVTKCLVWARSRHPDFGAENLSRVVNGAIRRNYLGVRCVPFSAPCATHFSVSYIGEFKSQSP